MPTVEDVRLILERTFVMPVAESDAQIVLDRLNEIASKESAQQSVEPTVDIGGGLQAHPAILAAILPDDE